MLNNIYAFVVLFLISVGTAILIYALVSRSLCALLDEVIRLSSGTTFYLRLFLTGLILIALSSVFGTTFDLKAGSAFMEYVWKVAGGVSSAFAWTSLFLMGYLVVVTILVVVLRRRNDQ